MENVAPHRHARNRTLFGLRTDADVVVKYDPHRGVVESVSGRDIDPTDVRVSDVMKFNVPAYVAVADVPLYPSTYEISQIGIVTYHGRRPPGEGIRLHRSDHGLDEGAKIAEYTVTLEKLRQFDTRRPRSPSQRKVMGESAEAHAQRLIEAGRITVVDNIPVSWHWCHLVGFSFLPTHRAQRKGNLVCGTSAFNGQMVNVEAAVKAFVYEYGRPLAIEITASHLRGTHLGIRLRYRIYDRNGSRLMHSEYYDAVSPTQSDFSDYAAVYERLVLRFQPNG